MGQKINPLGFRLGTTQNHHSIWFAQPKSFPAGLEEDKKIRDSIKNFVQKNMERAPGSEGIARIEIRKELDVIRVIIHIGFLDLSSKEETQLIKELEIDLQKKVNPVNHRFKIAIKRIQKPYGQPKILAEYIAFQLQNRVSFRKAMKKAVELAQKTDTKGIRVQIAGRIDGKEMARVEWIREGRVPLQTIRAKIDYCSYTVRTIHGLLGIKIWIFVDEES
uniref:ribosomal protein S3 n=1 Tax=Echinodorus grisebachii TaxID=430093 RepID=UPI003001ED20|nr:ribosomal protein S3 [Echinodorus cordifolius]WRM53863.1 ribosomal protein S3 [Echinodorus grisebachii]